MDLPLRIINVRFAQEVELTMRELRAKLDAGQPILQEDVPRAPLQPEETR